MAYRFDPALELDLEFKRVAIELVHEARHQLTQTSDLHVGIHEARRRFKKMRGLLRMARFAMGEASYSTENARWRDASRTLSTLRDATALIEACDALAERFEGTIDLGVTLRFREYLTTRREALTATESDLSESVATVLDELKLGESVIRDLALPGHSPADFIAGLGKVYTQTVRGYSAADGGITDEGFHDWRKRVKYHWMHLQLVRDVWPAPLRTRARNTKLLSDIVGDDHDLAVMADVLTHMDVSQMSTNDVSVLRMLISQRRAELQSRALEIGRSLCFRSPVWLAERLNQIWVASQYRAPGAQWLDSGAPAPAPTGLNQQSGQPIEL